MGLQHEEISFSLPCVEVYLWRSKGSMRFDFWQASHRVGFWGMADIFFLSIERPADAASRYPWPTS